MIFISWMLYNKNALISGSLTGLKLLGSMRQNGSIWYGNHTIDVYITRRQELFAAQCLRFLCLCDVIGPKALAAAIPELKQALLSTCGILARQSKESAVALIIKIIYKQAKKGDNIAVSAALECIKEYEKVQGVRHKELALIKLYLENITTGESSTQRLLYP